MQEIAGYKRSWMRTLFTWCAIAATLGGLRLLFHWRKHWMLACTHVRSSLRDAQKVMLVVRLILGFSAGIAADSTLPGPL